MACLFSVYVRSESSTMIQFQLLFQISINEWDAFQGWILVGGTDFRMSPEGQKRLFEHKTVGASQRRGLIRISKKEELAALYSPSLT